MLVSYIIYIYTHTCTTRCFRYVILCQKQYKNPNYRYMIYFNQFMSTTSSIMRAVTYSCDVMFANQRLKMDRSWNIPIYIRSQWYAYQWSAHHTTEGWFITNTRISTRNEMGMTEFQTRTRHLLNNMYLYLGNKLYCTNLLALSIYIY